MKESRFPDVGRASRDRDTYADRTRDTVLYRDERETPHRYDWCYLEDWANSRPNGGIRGLRLIVMRHGRRKGTEPAWAP
jgi:hypothetical protein